MGKEVVRLHEVGQLQNRNGQHHQVKHACLFNSPGQYVAIPPHSPPVLSAQVNRAGRGVTNRRSAEATNPYSGSYLSIDSQRTRRLKPHTLAHALKIRKVNSIFQS